MGLIRMLHVYMACQLWNLISYHEDEGFCLKLMWVHSLTNTNIILPKPSGRLWMLCDGYLNNHFILWELKMPLASPFTSCSSSCRHPARCGTLISHATGVKMAVAIIHRWICIIMIFFIRTIFFRLNYLGSIIWIFIYSFY